MIREAQNGCSILKKAGNRGFVKEKREESYGKSKHSISDIVLFHGRYFVTVQANPKHPGSGGKMIMKFKDIKLGAATASMFEVPRDYKKAAGMYEVMGAGGMGNMAERMKKMPKGQRSPTP